MGALFKNTCYPSQEEARTQACNSLDVKVMSGGTLFTSECTSSVYTDATMTVCKRTDGGACTNVPQPWPDTPTCDYAGGSTLALDWFYVLITFLIIVYGFKRLIALFDAPHQPE